MLKLFYITTNKGKIHVANRFLSEHGIEVVSKKASLTEIQSESIEKIAVHKAQQAYELFKHPLLVNDAGWYIPALNGFPGPFMKYIDEWFKTEDFLQLMKDKTDKRIFFKEVSVYIDENGYKTFTQELAGNFLSEAKGSSAHLPLKRVISLSATGKSIAECIDENISPTAEYGIWESIAAFLKTR